MQINLNVEKWLKLPVLINKTFYLTNKKEVEGLIISAKN